MNDEFILFSEVAAHVGFHDEKLRNEFDQQLKLYQSQGKDKAIIHKYLGDIMPQL